MDFAPSPRAADLTERVRSFIAEEIEPVEPGYHADLAEQRRTGDPWRPLPLIEELKAKARERGLWNLFLPHEHAGEYAARFGTDGGEGLTNVDYAPVAELTGRSHLAPLVLQLQRPRHRQHGGAAALRQPTDQRREWLEPLLDGRIRSAFTMTEPGVASSDATNMEATAVVDGDEVVINGRKWWSTGVGHPDCKVLDLHGADGSRRRPPPPALDGAGAAGRPGREGRAAAHRRWGCTTSRSATARCRFTDVRVPAANILLGPGEAFAIAQGRLGPGRVHHCMRLIGLAELALEMACTRGAGADRVRQADRQPRRQPRADRRRPDRDRPGPAAGAERGLEARHRRAAERAVARSPRSRWPCPNMAQQVIDMAIQLHGGGGLSDDFPLAGAWTDARALRLADGPDEVHRGVVARLELGKYGAVAMSRVLITGAASGLGAALAAAFSARGDEVLRTDSSAGADLTLDVTTDDDWAAALAHVERDLGRARRAGQQRRRRRRRPARRRHASTSGGGSPRSTCSAWSAAPRTFVPMFKRQRSRPRSSTSPRWPAWCTRPGWRPTTR